MDRSVKRQKGQSSKTITRAVIIFIVVLLAELGVAAYLFFNEIGMGEIGDWHLDLDRMEYLRVSNNSFGAVVVTFTMTLFVGIFILRGMRRSRKR